MHRDSSSYISYLTSRRPKIRPSASGFALAAHPGGVRVQEVQVRLLYLARKSYSQSWGGYVASESVLLAG